MEYYLNIQNNKIINCSNQPSDVPGIKSYPVEEQLYYDYIAYPDKYIWKNNKPIIDPEYTKNMEIKRETEFKKQFFETSLGWIRRYPTLADGSKDNFLNDSLPLFAITMVSGTPTYLPIAYSLPDFTKDLTEQYMESLQIKNQVITNEFILECMQVKLKDFEGQSNKV